MKKLLFISTRPILPIVGGDQIRTAQQLKFLLQRYIVDVVYLYSDDKNTDLLKTEFPEINDIKTFYSPRWRSVLYTLRFLVNTLPLQVNYYYDSDLKRYIDKHALEYDAIFCNNIRTAEYVIHLTGIIKYIDFVDAISMNYEKAWKKAQGIKKIIYWIDCKRCRKYEKKVLVSFDSCAIISNVDKQYILDAK